MKGLVKWCLLPAVLLAGMTVLQPQVAEARRRVVRVAVRPARAVYRYPVPVRYRYRVPLPVPVYRGPVLVAPPLRYGPILAPPPVVRYRVW